MTWIEQPVEVNHEVAHMGVVHGLLCLRLPGRVGGCVIGIYAHDLDLVVDVGRVIAEAVGPPDQPQIFGREKSHSALDPAAAQHIAKKLFQRAGFVS